jgi:hypothetical protein
VHEPAVHMYELLLSNFLHRAILAIAHQAPPVWNFSLELLAAALIT